MFPYQLSITRPDPYSKPMQCSPRDVVLVLSKNWTNKKYENAKM